MLKLIKNKNFTVSNEYQIGAYVYPVRHNYTLKPDEEECTNAHYIDYLFSVNIIDYRQLRFCYQYLGLTFGMQPDNVKDNIVKHCAVSDNICLTYLLVNKGMSQQEAMLTYVLNRAEQVTNSANCCKQYIESALFKKALLMSMPISEALRFYKENTFLIQMYKDLAHMGLCYNDTERGIMDFILTEPNGLASYTLNNGVSLNVLRNELDTLLYWGGVK